jgi:predicted signal transduction protein with EAL and GGDEF domain
MIPVASVVDETALDPGGDDEVGTTQEDRARWRIAHLGQVYPDEFVKSAQLVGIPVH